LILVFSLETAGNQLLRAVWWWLAQLFWQSLCRVGSAGALDDMVGKGDFSRKRTAEREKRQTILNLLGKGLREVYEEMGR